MAKITLITGGGRSGKSSYAQGRAEELPGTRAFVATCPALDDEMRKRIKRHRLARSKTRWKTIEETLDVAGALKDNLRHDVFLVDCLTLWVNNLMYRAQQEDLEVTEDAIADHCRELIATCGELSGTIIFVTNEVGMGIVPDNAVSRRYRDLVGRCNQLMAEAADEVVLVSCGLPLTLKQRKQT
jgi:adenosylcobinamide kinase/adenosylcobinamide-phosphate guanylyltransferase